MKKEPFKVDEHGGVNSWEKLMFLYNAALKEVVTKIENLKDEYKCLHQYEPVEHIKARIKTAESIVKKLKKYGHESTFQNMYDYVNDIAGVRVICPFISDIYTMVEMIHKQDDLKVITVKDYIKSPKKSGYASYHILVTVPIFMGDDIIDTKVEIQIRTIAQDFWASLEHKIYYKYEGNAPANISKDLRECAKYVADLDAKMFALNCEVNGTNTVQQLKLHQKSYG